MTLWQEQRGRPLSALQCAQIEFARLLENRTIGATGEMILSFLKLPC